MSRRSSLRSAPFRLERLESRAVPATITWDGGPGGNGANWLDQVNWRDAGGNDVLPGPADDVVLAPTGTSPAVVLSGNATVRSVVCNRGLQVAGPQSTLTVAAGANDSFFRDLQLGPGTVLNLIGGAVVVQSTIGGAGQVVVTGPQTAALAGATTVTAPVTVFSGGTLAVGGTLGGTTTIEAGATLQVPGGDQLTVAGSLTNRGILDLLGYRIFVTGALVNAGLLVSHQGGAAVNEVVVAPGAQFRSTCGLRANTQDLSIRPLTPDSPGAVSVEGQVIADPGRTVRFLPQPITVTGNVTGNLAVYGGGTVSLAATPATLIGSIANVDGGTILNLSGTFNGVGNASMLRLITASITGTFNVPVAVNGTVTADAATFNRNFSVFGTLVVQSTVTATAPVTSIGNPVSIVLVPNPAGVSNLTLIGTSLNNGAGSIVTRAGTGAYSINLISSSLTIGGDLGSLAPSGCDLTVALSGTNATFKNDGSVFVPASRTLTVTGGPLVNTHYSSLSGSGTLVADVAGNGVTRPGDYGTIGRLTVVGSYTLLPGGTLSARINGPTPVTQYDQLVVNGTVTLAGTLAVTLGYSATANDTYRLIDNDGADAVAGTFTGLPPGAVVTSSEQSLSVSYAGGTGNDMTLTHVGGPTPPPRVSLTQINDGSVQRSMVTSLKLTFSTVVTLPADMRSAFVLTRIGGGAVNFGLTVFFSNDVIVVRLESFSGAEASPRGSLKDGRYSLTVRAAQISALGLALDGNGDGGGGDDFVFADSGTTTGNQLYRLFGDADGNRIVNTSDLTLFRTAFGASTPDITFDSDLNGVINATDLTAFRTNFGVVI